MKAFLVSVVCGEGDDKSFTPLKVFLNEESCDIFLEEKKKFFEREVMLYTIAHKLIREWTLANPIPTNRAFSHDYNVRLDAETKRAYALVGYIPNRLPSYATTSYIFRKDVIEAD